MLGHVAIYFFQTSRMTWSSWNFSLLMSNGKRSPFKANFFLVALCIPQSYPLGMQRALLDFEGQFLFGMALCIPNVAINIGDVVTFWKQVIRVGFKGEVLLAMTFWRRKLRFWGNFSFCRKIVMILGRRWRAEYKLIEN